MNPTERDYMSIRMRMLAFGAGLTLAGGLSLAAGAAHATTPLVSASTTISNDPDSGGNGFWADDGFTRTLTITQDTNGTDCTDAFGVSFTSTDSCYQATIADSGNAQTIVNAFQPNQGINPDGDKITGPAESVPFTGSASYLFYAPTADIPSATNVPATLDDHDSAPATNATTGYWFRQAFTTSVQGVVEGTLEDNWTWTYANGCESWTDSFVNNSGQSTPISTDGNITGEVCATPTPTGTTTPAPVTGVVGEISSFSDYSYSCLDNSDFNWADGNPIQLWKCGAAGGADQQFTLATVNGHGVLEAIAPAGKPQGPWCVTDNGAGARLTINLCTGNSDQVIAKQGPYYVFTASGDVMNDAGWYTGNGAGVIAWQMVGTRNERWSLP